MTSNVFLYKNLRIF